MISAGSTIVVVGALLAFIITSSGWPAFKESFLSWPDFRAAFPDVLKGFWLDVKLFVIVEIVVLIIGVGIALARTSRSAALFPLRLLGAVYTDLFRGLPVILVVYLFGFGIPALDLPGVPQDPTVLGGIALALCYSAYVAEVYRAGIDSVHPAQRSAALAIGLTEVQALRFVILPQAVRRVVPPLLNDFISLQKDVALISILGPLEAFRQAQIATQANFNYTPLLAAAVCYLAVTVPLARIVDRMQARAHHSTVGGTA